MKQPLLWWIRPRRDDPLLRRYTKLVRKRQEIEKALRRLERLLERRDHKKEELPTITF